MHSTDGISRGTIRMVVQSHMTHGEAEEVLDHLRDLAAEGGATLAQLENLFMEPQDDELWWICYEIPPHPPEFARTLWL